MNPDGSLQRRPFRDGVSRKPARRVEQAEDLFVKFCGDSDPVFPDREACEVVITQLSSVTPHRMLSLDVECLIGAQVIHPLSRSFL